MKTTLRTPLFLMFWSAVPVWAGPVTVLESFEDGIDAARLATWGDSRGVADPPVVTLSQHAKDGDADENVTHGENSLRVNIKEMTGWSADYEIVLSDEASQLVRNAASSREEARYQIRFDVVFPETGGLVPWMNSVPHIDSVTRGQLEAGGNPSGSRKKTMTIPLDLINQNLGEGEGPVVILVADNFAIEGEWPDGIDLHVDNVRLVDTYEAGSVPVVTVLNSFESEEDLGRIYEFNNWDPSGRYAASLHEAAGPDDLAVTDGEKSLQIDYTAGGGWAPDFEIDFRGTPLEQILTLPAEARQRYTLRFDVIYPSVSEGTWNGNWQNFIVRTQAGTVNYAMTRSSDEQHVRTYSMTLDAVEWPAPDLGNPDDENANLIVVGQGAWDAPGIAMHFDNFRLIDTGNVPLQIRDLVITDTGMLSLSWDSSESQAYSIDESPTLLDWQEMIAGIEGAPGGLTSYTVLDPPITGANHYRVRISGRAAPLRENFENGQGDWTIGRKETNAGGTDWEVGAVTSGPGAAHSGTNAAGTNLGGDTDAGAHIYLRSPLVDLTTYTSPPTLSFWHALEGSGTFAARVTVLDSNGSILLETGEGDPGFFMEGTDGWEEFSMPLNVTGQKVFVEFELIMQDVGPGWYVDDVLVSE